MYHSQDGQDLYLDKHVFKGLKNGIFVDIGANDGITINNTLFFEKNLNWTGINIEPIQSVYQKLCINRPNCINVNCAIDEHSGYKDFITNDGYTEMISGLKEHYDPRHYQRLFNENNIHKSSTKIIKVKTDRLEKILEDNNIKHVNYMSIDVEGAEFSVIKSINFDKCFIDLIAFEDNYKDQQTQDIIDYLICKNFAILKKTMDVFMINKASIFI